MSTTNDWIKFSDDWPKEPDFPVWVGSPGIIGGLMERAGNTTHTHWKRANRPAPPKEETQREKDEAWFFRWLKDNPGPCRLDILHAALRYERAEVLKMLDEAEKTHAEKVNYSAARIPDALRKRCTP